MNFVKPEMKIIDPIPYIQKIIGKGLIKHLCNDEVICNSCHGTGIILADNPYNLRDDPNKKIGHFPYVHQSFKFCPDCYNGVVHRCDFCGKIIRPRWNLVCNCEKSKKIDVEKKKQKKQKEFDKAKELPENLKEDYDFYYSDYYGFNNGYFEDWETFFNYWNENYDEKEERPKYVWITEKVNMKIDALSIVESATEDLYEDSMNDISERSLNELQQFLNSWCKSCGIGDTYCESHKYKVKIPWEKY